MVVEQTAPNQVTWASGPPPWVHFREGSVACAETWGNFRRRADFPCTSGAQTIHSVEATPAGQVRVTGTLAMGAGCNGSSASFELLLGGSARSARQLGARVSVVPSAGVATGQRTAQTGLSGARAARGEAVFGGGLQYTHWNLEGRVLPVLIQEQGVGRGLQPVTALLDLFKHGAGGDWHTSYGGVGFAR